jgi:GNAT superfamily N-acetyltransferase
MAGNTYLYGQDQHGHLIPYIAALHASCMTLDHMVGPFLPPLTNEKLLPWWKERIAEAAHGTRVIVLLLPENHLGKKPEGTDLRGLAMLKLSETETGSFRGHIDAVLVDRKYRRRGGAKALVAALEYEAARRGRSLLVGCPYYLPLALDQWLTLSPARPHGDGQRGGVGLQNVWIHRDRQGAALQPGSAQRQEGRDLLLQGVHLVVLDWRLGTFFSSWNAVIKWYYAQNDARLR